MLPRPVVRGYSGVTRDKASSLRGHVGATAGAMPAELRGDSTRPVRSSRRTPDATARGPANASLSIEHSVEQLYPDRWVVAERWVLRARASSTPGCANNRMGGAIAAPCGQTVGRCQRPGSGPAIAPPKIGRAHTPTLGVYADAGSAGASRVATRRVATSSSLGSWRHTGLGIGPALPRPSIPERRPRWSGSGSGSGSGAPVASHPASAPSGPRYPPPPLPPPRSRDTAPDSQPASAPGASRRPRARSRARDRDRERARVGGQAGAPSGPSYPPPPLSPPAPEPPSGSQPASVPAGSRDSRVGDELERESGSGSGLATGARVRVARIRWAPVIRPPLPPLDRTPARQAARRTGASRRGESQRRIGSPWIPT